MRIPPQSIRLLVALGLLLTSSGSTFAQTVESLVGTYRRMPVENGYHEGTISVKPGSDGKTLQWKNKAGVTWNLFPDLSKGVMRTDKTNPYFDKGGNECALEIEDGRVISFVFLNETYYRDQPGGIVARIPQKSGGLKGYISMSLGAVPAGYGYGVSFYVATWPLLEKPLSGFQIGLPSTWILPDNRDFNQPLCPPGTVARDNWPERGPYYRDVFQTIEGGLGFWVSTQFASGTPKYRINGTPNGYNHEISSPGWGFGQPKALAPEKMGIAQLSNHLLVPPDGLTFKDGTAGELLGNAWMALPLFPAKQPPATSPTGDRSWTLFLNASNFKGPVACWIPETWSKLSKRYRVIDGRGLDARPGLMNGGAMEVNTVPYLESKDSSGVRYTRIPRLQFPIDARGESVLMQDVVMYSDNALFNGVRSAVQQKSSAAWKFNPKAGFRPTIQANPISMKQGDQNLLLDGIGAQVQTRILGGPGGQAFGLKWANAKNWGALPEYYRHEGGKMMAVPEAQVPQETGLTRQKFRPGGKGQPYTSPEGSLGNWAKPGPKAGPFTATLTDGSVVTYAWYRFIDQPSIVALDWPEPDRAALQSMIERLHAEWATTGDYMPAPGSGTLATLDASMKVEPPKGLEVGYVPIVIRQAAKE
ncbi:MAG TPA: hypothetical protein VK968_10030 [Roseimicrobium sp.]|nr:hypothetical protein [Roseimicrobium sp.]